MNVCRYTHEAWKEMISNCSIIGDTVGTFNTGNALQNTPCTTSAEVDSMVSRDTATTTNNNTTTTTTTVTTTFLV